LFSLTSWENVGTVATFSWPIRHLRQLATGLPTLAISECELSQTHGTHPNARTCTYLPALGVITPSALHIRFPYFACVVLCLSLICAFLPRVSMIPLFLLLTVPEECPLPLTSSPHLSLFCLLAARRPMSVNCKPTQCCKPVVCHRSKINSNTNSSLYRQQLETNIISAVVVG
jgi:hypothetical protein